MQNGRILGAALALAMVCAVPGTSALDLGGQAFAAKGDRKNAENRKIRINKRNGSKAGKSDKKAKPTHIVRRDVGPRRVGRLARNNFWVRNDFRPRRPRRFARGLNRNSFCMRPRRIERRLYRQGWDVYSFRRAGRHFEAGARNRHGQRHSLTVHGCDGHVIAARNIEPRRKSRLKRALRKIRRTFKKIF